MKINLDKKKSSPLYLQLYDAVADEIRAGRLRSGTKLPSRREMAKLLGVSNNTVDSAYKMLQDTGYVISIPRSGYMVSFKSLSYEHITPWETRPSEEIVFSPNGISHSYLNRSLYAKIIRDTAYNDSAEIFSYVDKSGERELRQEISKYLYSFRNIKCSPDRIIIGAGAEYLLTALLRVFADDMTVIAENPCDAHFYQTLAAYGCRADLLPPNTKSFNISALKKFHKGLFLVDPYSRFPRGKGMSEAECKAVLEWASAGKKRYVIEDGTRAELSPFSGEPLYSADQSDKVIYLGSFAKALCPAIKTSYMILPEKVLEKWKIHHTYYYALSSKLEQYALAKFIEKGYFTKHYKNMRRIYKEKLDCLCGHLKNEFGSSVEICDICGTYLTAYFKEKSAREIKIRARRNGVKLMSESSFCAGGAVLPDNEDKLTLGIGDLSRAEIRRGIILLKHIF